MFPRMGLNAKSLCRRCQSRVAGLSWLGEAVHMDLVEDAKICTAKYITVTHILLTRFGIESQQSFPTFQQIYHTCQLWEFRSGPCLSSCYFLGKKKHLPTLTHTPEPCWICCASADKLAGVRTAYSNAPWCIRVTVHVRQDCSLLTHQPYAQDSELFGR